MVHCVAPPSEDVNATAAACALEYSIQLDYASAEGGYSLETCYALPQLADNSAPSWDVGSEWEDPEESLLPSGATATLCFGFQSEPSTLGNNATSLTKRVLNEDVSLLPP